MKKKIKNYGKYSNRSETDPLKGETYHLVKPDDANTANLNAQKNRMSIVDNKQIQLFTSGQ